MRRHRLIALPLALTVLASCGDETGVEDIEIGGVAVTPGTVELSSIGATAQLAAQASDVDGNAVDATFTWQSSDPSVAAVDASGEVRAVAEGTATVTATVEDGTESGTATVTVEQTVETLTVTPETETVDVGETVQLTVAAEDAGGTAVDDPDVTWTSSDEAVASVDGSGLVRGEGEGEATITATAGDGSDDATVTVVRPDVVIAEDTELGGDVVAGTFTVEPGVAVTLTSDVTVRAAGEVRVEGTMAGDCTAVDIQGDTAVTVSGSIQNGCAADGAERAGVRIAADGELTLDGAEIESQGAIDLTNDVTLTEEDFTDGSLATASGPDRTDHTILRYRMVGSTITFKGTGAGRDPAQDGADGLDGTAGRDGSDIRLLLRGDAEFAGNTVIWGQNGGDGGDGAETNDQDIVVRGGDGGDGGDLKLFVTGDVTYSGVDNVLRSGGGGHGGAAEAEATANANLAKAPSATAEGGDGGDPGLVEVRAGGSITLGAGALTVEIGQPGDGGFTSALAADGVDATDTRPAQPGGDAFADGGNGGATPDLDIVRQGAVTGPDPTVEGAGEILVDGGHGGTAVAVAGNGGDGSEQNKAGADGGAIRAEGGEGGDALLQGLGVGLGKGGDGGFADLEGGNGGLGWDDCTGTPTVAGGDAGDGGDVQGFDGGVGKGAAPFGDGDTGNMKVLNAANGGEGGDGDGPGSGGGAGADNTIPNGSINRINSFQPGDDGNPCTPTAPTPFTIQVSQIPASSGVVANGTYSVAITSDGGTSGSLSIVASGDAETHFKGSGPDRLGLAHGGVWTFDLASVETSEGTPDVQSLQMCPINTSGLSQESPMLITAKAADGSVLQTWTWHPGLAGTSGPARSGHEQECPNPELPDGTARVDVETSPGTIIDLAQLLLFMFVL